MCAGGREIVKKKQGSEIISSPVIYKSDTWLQSKHIDFMPLVGLPVVKVLLGLGMKGTGIGYSWRQAANGNSFVILRRVCIVWVRTGLLVSC